MGRQKKLGPEVEVVNQFEEEKAVDRCFMAVGKKKGSLLSVYYALRPWIKERNRDSGRSVIATVNLKKDRGFEQKTSP